MFKQVIEANVPTLESFLAIYPHYTTLAAQEEGVRVFGLVMSPVSFLKAQFATELKLPAVTGVAEVCSQNVPLTHHLKQYIGALVCHLMQANGYSKDKDRTVPHPAFTKGKTYKLESK